MAMVAMVAMEEGGKGKWRCRWRLFHLECIREEMMVCGSGSRMAFG